MGTDRRVQPVHGSQPGAAEKPMDPDLLLPDTMSRNASDVA